MDNTNRSGRLVQLESIFNRDREPTPETIRKAWKTLDKHEKKLFRDLVIAKAEATIPDRRFSDRFLKLVRSLTPDERMLL